MLKVSPGCNRNLLYKATILNYKMYDEDPHLEFGDIFIVQKSLQNTIL